MNPIEQIRAVLAENWPDLNLKLDPPANEAGIWLLTISIDGSGTRIFVEWRPDVGFGISVPLMRNRPDKPEETRQDTLQAFGLIMAKIITYYVE